MTSHTVVLQVCEFQGPLKDPQRYALLVAQTYSRQISVKLTKDVFFAPTRTT